MSRQVCNVCVCVCEREGEREGGREEEIEIYMSTGYCSFDSENTEL